MKFFYAFLLMFSLLLFACGAEQSTSSELGKNEQLQQLKEELSQKTQDLARIKEQISQLQQELPEEGLMAEEEAVLIRSFPLQIQLFRQEIEVRGSVQSDKNIIVSAEVAGVIKKIYIETGSYVKKGQHILHLDTELLQNNLSEIRNELSLATLIHERQKKLWENNIGSEIQYLQTATRKQALERKEASLLSQIRKSHTQAPFSGTIEEIFAQESEMAAPGMPLFRVFTPNDIYIQAEVSDTYINDIKKGSPVQLRVLSTSQKFKSSISYVSRILNDKNRTFSVRVDVSREEIQLYPNQVVAMLIENYSNKEALSIPSRLIQKGSKGEYVYRIKEENGQKRAEKVQIQTSLSYQGQTEVISGLRIGDQIIDQGANELTTDALVRLTDKETL